MNEIAWSSDEESFNLDNKWEAIEDIARDYDRKELLGRVVWYGQTTKPDVSTLVDADEVIEMLGERAYDNHGEWAWDFPNVSDKAKKLLDNYLQKWIKKHTEVTFWTVKDIKEYVITEEDVAQLLGD